jgi:hypothetical protein
MSWADIASRTVLIDNEPFAIHHRISGKQTTGKESGIFAVMD